MSDRVCFTRKKFQKGTEIVFSSEDFFVPNSVMMMITGNVPTETSTAFILHFKKISGLDAVYLDLKLKMFLAALYPIILGCIIWKLNKSKCHVT